MHKSSCSQLLYWIIYTGRYVIVGIIETAVEHWLTSIGFLFITQCFLRDASGE